VTVKVCISVSAPDTSDLLGKVQQAERLTADLIEVRLDKLRSYHGLSKVGRSVSKPLIATNRPLSEKGSFAGSEAERLKILREAVESGFEYVDLEMTTSNLERVKSSFHQQNVKIILSHHDHFRTPDHARLNTVLNRMQKMKPDVSKIVTTAQLPDDNLTLLGFLQKNHRGLPLVGFAMGQAGVWSRLLAPFYGSAFTYACLGKGMETALGQLTVSELRNIYELLGLE
jgi:3-dehydroquinate dehydratase-1